LTNRLKIKHRSPRARRALFFVQMELDCAVSVAHGTTMANVPSAEGHALNMPFVQLDVHLRHRKQIGVAAADCVKYLWGSPTVPTHVHQ